jgi:hypothetical protein
MTPRASLQKFYHDNALGPDGGLHSSSVKIKMANNFHVYFPNFNARRKAVIRHDIHHMVTGYSAASLIGESEISAWEIASGCKKYWAAFMIDTHGMLIGLPIHPWRVVKAFARGRRTKNLYHDTIALEEALDTPISDLKGMLALDVHGVDTTPGLTDWIIFLLFLLFAAVYALASVVLLPVIILYTLYHWIK